MKKKIKYILVSFIFIVSTYVAFSFDGVQAVSQEEAGKYIAEFAINFFDAHGSETTYNRDGGRNTTYTGSKYGGKYAFDCVGWVSFAIHQATGFGNDAFTEFAIPSPNNAPGYFNGFQEVYGKVGSRNVIPIEELKQQLKPGDAVLKNAQHVLLYVGDGTLIHCTGHGPGPEYGGSKGYGLIKETIEHFYASGYGIESIGRVTEEAAATINDSECTTVFGETGKGLTGIWEKASQGGSGNPGSGWDNGTSSGGTQSGGANTKVIEKGFQADYELGLVYPKDNKNTPLNNFIDFTLPFLQTWMIPLAMNSGAIDSSYQENKGNNAKFTYLTIKEAMSDIIVDRYDITKCTLKTKYKVYDTITYQVSHDSDGNKSTTEIGRVSTDESSNGPKAEQFVSKNFDVNTKYCIKKAHTFDVKIDNEYKYDKYSDSDVEERINPDQENKENGDSFSEGGDPGGDGSYTYTVKEGHYVNVTRIWEDKFEIGDSHVEDYTVDDVKTFIESPPLVANKVTSSQSNSSDGEIFNGTKYEVTEDEKIRLAKFVYQEYNGDTEGMKAVASHMCNLYEYYKWTGAISQNKSFTDYILSGSWYGQATRNNQNYNDEAIAAVEQCIINGQRTLPLYVNEFDMYPAEIKNAKGKDEYVQHETEVKGAYGGEGLFYKIFSHGSDANLFYYDKRYKEYIESGEGTEGVQTNTSSSEIANKNNGNPEVDTRGLGEFDGSDKKYYKLVKLSDKINRVDMVNAKPENYLQYLRKGSQYSNHVGYSRGFLVFGYDELRKLFKEQFKNKATLPFVYGSSLGYNTYDAEYVMDAGTFDASSGGVSGNVTQTVPGAVQVPDGLGKLHTWTIWNHVNEQYNPRSTWPKDSAQGKLILYLTNNNEESLHGQLAGNITANSKRMVCYGEWLASAMVSELGGTQGNPEKRLQIGDLVFIIQDNGTVYPVMITDTKVQFKTTYYDPNPANEWGHLNGQNMTEFQGYTSSWRDVPPSPEEFNHYIKQVYVVGNVYSNPEYLNDINKAAKDVGIDTGSLINPKTM